MQASIHRPSSTAALTVTVVAHWTVPDGVVTLTVAQYFERVDVGESVDDMSSVSMTPTPVEPEKTRLVAPGRRVRRKAYEVPRVPSKQ